MNSRGWGAGFKTTSLLAREPLDPLAVAPRAAKRPRVAIVHDYLTQRGGAERVVLTLTKAFPEAPVYTSVYEPDQTFPEFASIEVRPSGLNRVAAFRRWHRAALPFYARAFSRMNIDADIVLCSSSGWAHGVSTTGRKVVYCYAPARWLYQTDTYLGGRRLIAALLRPLFWWLKRWDRAAALSADLHLTSSAAVRERIGHAYNRTAELVPPPSNLDPHSAQEAVPGVAPGFVLCVSRLLPYKNVAEVVRAFATIDERLVVVGVGPEAERLRAMATPNVQFLQDSSDAQLRWLYASSLGIVSASFEDYGLTPIEANSFGKPAAVLRDGGFLDTVKDGLTGVFFDRPVASSVVAGVTRMLNTLWDPELIKRHAEQYNEEQFIRRLRTLVYGVGPETGSSLPVWEHAERRVPA